MSTRILIVEDDGLSLKLMRDALRAVGFDTRETGAGDDALELAVDFAADLVVMDIGLPGIDGVEATRQLKADERTNRIPVVAVSAFAMQDDERRMREAGCSVFLTKPIRLGELVNVVAELVGRANRS
jgi:two-component system cell cycle response regulator DivK